MQDLQKQAQSLKQAVADAITGLQIDKLERRISELTKTSQLSSFWTKSDKAQATMKELSALQERVQAWRNLQSGVDEVLGLISLQDEGLRSGIEDQFKALEHNYLQMKKELQLSGPYDDQAVLVSIYAGAGGTDAQDWTQMLMRMYLRWAEQQKLTVRTIIG